MTHNHPRDRDTGHLEGQHDAERRTKKQQGRSGAQAGRLETKEGRQGLGAAQEARCRHRWARQQEAREGRTE